MREYVLFIAPFLVSSRQETFVNRNRWVFFGGGAIVELVESVKTIAGTIPRPWLLMGGGGDTRFFTSGFYPLVRATLHRNDKK